jgi:hypothetical protein
MLQVLLWIPVAVVVRDLLVDASFERASDGTSNGGVMAPTVRASELVVINKLDMVRRALVTGDVVALKTNDVKTNNRFNFRRLLAMEGDWVRKKDNSFEQVGRVSLL